MFVNGSEVALEAAFEGALEDALEGARTLKSFLEREGYALDRVAVEKNGKIVPKTRYADVLLDDGDRLEIVAFVGGG